MVMLSKGNVRELYRKEWVYGYNAILPITDYAKDISKKIKSTFKAKAENTLRAVRHMVI